MATEFRRLLVRVRRIAGERGVRLLMVTSARRGEGKTTTATHLALTAALHGKGEVVVVDLDLRRPRVHSALGVQQRLGVTDVLCGDAALEGALKDTPVRNLKALTSGRPMQSPSTLLGGPAVRGMFSRLRSRFELVLVDTPPVIPVTDAMVLAPEVDGTLLVVMAGETPRAVVQRARQLMVEADARLLGVVVNNVDEVLPYYYDYKYYGYETEEVPEGLPGPEKERT